MHMLTPLSHTLTSLLLGLRDGLRPRLILTSLLSLMAVVTAWFVLFSVADDQWWSLSALGERLAARTHLDASIAKVLAGFLFALSYAALVMVSMGLVILFVLMPRIRQVCLQAYPSLTPVSGSLSLMGPLRNALWLVLAFLLGLVLSWTVPVWGGLAFVALVSYFNVRGLLYDALDGLATTREQEAVLRQQRGAILMLGLALSGLAMVPVLGLLSPAIMGTSASHLAFRGLTRLRGRALAI
jgi:hypothetical protein